MHRIGEIIEDRYQLIRPLGIRQGAEWWEAEHEVVGRRVTLKLLGDELADDPEIQQRLVLESRAAAEICHPTAVEVYDVGVTADGEAFLVAEPLHGEMLADLIARHGALDPKDACRIAIDILGGVEAAHAVGMVHGALTTSRVIVRRDPGGKLVVKILDFGLDLSASPPSADLSAMGAMLYEMLTGRPAQDAPDGLDRAAPPDLVRVVEQAMSREPDRAVPSARQLADQLAPFAAPPDLSSLAPRDTLLPFLSPEARRSRGLARLEQDVLGEAEPPPASARPSLVRLSVGAGGSRRPTPHIPRPPRAPEHFASAPDRRTFGPGVSSGWTAGILAAGIGVGLLLARLLHI